MSIHVSSLVWRKSRNARTMLLLELLIADFAHDDGRGAWPSVYTLAKKTRMTERNVQLLMDKLIESQEVSVVEGGGPYGTNAYAINVRLLESLPDVVVARERADESEELAPPEGGENFSPPAREISPGGEKSRAKHARNFTGGVKNRAPSTREISPDPSFNLSMNHPSDPSNNSSSTRVEKEASSESEIPAAAAVKKQMDLHAAEIAHVQLVLERAGFNPPVPKNFSVRVPLGNALVWAYWVKAKGSAEFDSPFGFAVNQLTLAPERPPAQTDTILREMLADPFRLRCQEDGCAFCAGGKFEKVVDARLAEGGLSRVEYEAEQARLQRHAARRAEKLERALQKESEPIVSGGNELLYPENVWSATLSEVQLQMTKATFDTWVKPTFVLDYCAERDELVIGVRNAYAKQWLDDRLSGVIEQTLNHVVGRPLKEITFELKTRDEDEML